MNDSILETIKKLLGIAEDQKDFDTDIIIHINSVFSKLKRLGVGPTDGFSIQDEYPIWNDFIQDNQELNDVITYMYLRVKLLFDPPLNSVVTSSMERTINELEWGLNITAESTINNEEE